MTNRHQPLYGYDYYVKYIKPRKVREYNQPHYFTWDNGLEPFVVYISWSVKSVAVYSQPNGPHDRLPLEKKHHVCGEAVREYYTKCVWRSTNIEDIWIGKSRDVSGNYLCYGSPEYDGNSILVCNQNLSYTFIGADLFSFTAYARIVSHYSPMGNNSVPYPFAVDVEGRHYDFTTRRCFEDVTPDVHPCDVFDSERGKPRPLMHVHVYAERR